MADLTFHQGQPVLAAGKPLAQAKAAVIMVHGRGATARDILSLSREFDAPDVAYLAPQANGNAWYPYRFMEPIAANEPYLSSALAVIDGLVKHVEGTGIPRDKIVLLGFSQGACLATEFAARNAGRYGGVVGLSGGLIGPDGTPRDYPGSMAGTPVFLGCSDVDFHIPKERVDETARIFQALGGDVTERLYPNMDHTINEDEIDFVNGLLGNLVNVEA